MGKVEKIVVLSVLFLIVLILAVTLSTSASDPTGSGRLDRLAGGLRADAGGASQPGQVGPEEGAAADSAASVDHEVALEDEPAAGRDWNTGFASRSNLEGAGGEVSADAVAAVDDPSLGRIVEQPSGTAPSLLDSEVNVLEGSAARGEGGRIRTSFNARRDSAGSVPRQTTWDLITTTGLVSSGHPDFLKFEVSRGLSFEDVARRFYGDSTKAELLRRNNEGIAVLSEGLTILVPVIDDTPPPPRVHVVADGENLWSISKQYYAQGGRWKEIFDANLRLLESPDDLRVGMELAVPVLE